MVRSSTCSPCKQAIKGNVFWIRGFQSSILRYSWHSWQEEGQGNRQSSWLWCRRLIFFCRISNYLWYNRFWVMVLWISWQAGYRTRRDFHLTQRQQKRRVWDRYLAHVLGITRSTNGRNGNPNKGNPGNRWKGATGHNTMNYVSFTKQWKPVPYMIIPIIIKIIPYTHGILACTVLLYS